MALLGARRDKAAAPLVAVQLTHPIPIVRYYAAAALEAMLDGKAPFDVHANNEAIVQSANRWLTDNGLKPLATVRAASVTPGETDE